MNHQVLAHANTGLGGLQQGSTVSIRSGGASPPSTFMEDKRGGNPNFGGGGSKERSQKILDQNSKEVLDYLGNFENKLSPKHEENKTDRENNRSSEPRRDRSI